MASFPPSFLGRRRRGLTIALEEHGYRGARQSHSIVVHPFAGEHGRQALAAFASNRIVMIDWQLVVQIGVPVGSLFLGAWVTRWFERRPSLTSYFSHVSAFQHSLSDGNKAQIFTHSVVVRNAGKRTATNVRLRHATLPSFQVFPSIEYKVNDLPDGSKEIAIPSMVPNEQITISYLYFPPLTYAGVNAGIKSDDGFAKEIPVLLQRQYPKWFNALAGILLLVGCSTTLYLVVIAVRHLIA